MRSSHPRARRTYGLIRFTTISTNGERASAVSSEARNTEGPTSGKATSPATSPQPHECQSHFGSDRRASAVRTRCPRRRRIVVDEARGRRGRHWQDLEAQRFRKRTRVAGQAKRARFRHDTETRRVVKLQVRSATRADRAPAARCAHCPLSGQVVDRCRYTRVDDEGRRLHARASLLERQEHRVALRHARVGWDAPPLLRSTPSNRPASSPSESCAGCCERRSAPRRAAGRPPRRARDSAPLRRWR